MKIIRYQDTTYCSVHVKDVIRRINYKAGRFLFEQAHFWRPRITLHRVRVEISRRKGDRRYSYRDFTVGGGAVERTGQGCHWQVNPGGAGIVGQTTPVPWARSTDARGRGNAQLVRLPATPVSRG